MKLSSGLLAAVLVPAGLARLIHVEDGGDETLEERLKVSAFVIHEDGKPAVECWEIGDEFEPRAATANGGANAASHRVEIAGAAYLSSCSIVTWPPRSTCWPPVPYRTNDYCGYCQGPVLTRHCGGGPVIIYGCYGCHIYGLENGNSSDPFDRQVIFTGENGDNWFYFHDARSGSHNYSDILAAEADDPPFTIGTFGNNNARLLTLEFDKFKNKTKLHDGVCNFGGVEIPDEKSHRKHAKLDVSLHIQDL